MRIIFAFSFLIYSITISAQVTQGQYEMGLLKWELTDDFPGDSTMAATIVDRMNTELKKSKFAFNQNYIVTYGVDEYGDEIGRTLFDSKNNVSYTFMQSEGIQFYQIDTIKAPTSPQMEVSLESTKKLTEKRFGFNLEESTYLFAGKEITFVHTSDVIQPEGNTSTLSPIPMDFFMVEMRITEMGLVLSMGITDFSKEISNEKVFSTSIEGYQSRREFLSGLEEAFDFEDEKQKGEGINLDILEKLNDDGFFEETPYDFNYFWESNVSVDKFRILELMKNDATQVINLPIDSLESVMLSNNMVSPKAFDLFEKCTSKNADLETSEKWNLLMLCALRKHLDQKENRVIITENFKEKNKAFGFSETAFNDFTEGKIQLEEFLLKAKIFHKLATGKVKNNKDLTKAARDFLNTALKKDIPDLKVKKKKNTLIISDGKREHSVLLNSLKEIDYDNYNEKKDTYGYVESFEIGASLFNELLPKVKQIAADNKLKYSYAIFDFREIFQGGIGYFYSLNKAFPEIKIFESEYVLLKFASDDYDLDGIGVSFLQKNAVELRQLEMIRMLIGDVDAGIEYITTETKDKFVDYLERNQKSRGLTKESLKETKKSIYENLYQAESQLIEMIPNLSTTVMSDHGLREPNISPERNSFKEVFPTLDKIVQGSFDAKNLTYLKEERKIALDFNGENYQLPRGNLEVMTEVAKILRKQENSEMDVYVQLGLWPSSVSQTYYYMTRKEKKELQQLLGIRFGPLK